MVKGIFAVLAGSAALLASGAAQAATYTFSFTAPTVMFGSAGDTYAGSGQLTTADTAGLGGLFAITGASGTAGIAGFPEYTYDITGASGSVGTRADGGPALASLMLGLSDGPRAISIQSNTAGGYEAFIGEVYAPDVAFTLTPLVSAVPEPAGWALMLLGFAAIGGGLRASRRRTRVVYC